MSDMKQVWDAFDEWERTQVCIRGHVRVVREEIEGLVKEHQLTCDEVKGLRDTRRRDSELIRSLAEERNELKRKLDKLSQ